MIICHYHLHSTATKELVDKYEQQHQQFMASTTVSQFKALFSASTTPYKLLTEKFSVDLNNRRDHKLNDQNLKLVKELVLEFSQHDQGTATVYT